jgi:hypothetical protein
MALSLSCPCGAAFEVEDTFAGQTVSCPECQGSVKVPALRQGPPRTSGLAVASLVLALVGAFTLVGTVAAVLCGLGALLHIGRSGGRLAGAGFAVLGMILGILFTGLTVFAYSQGELFGVGGRVREVVLGGRVDFSGPLEIVRPADGYKISRPSEKWGVANHELSREVDSSGNSLVLVNPSRDAFVQVYATAAFGRTVDQLRQDVIKACEKDEETQQPSAVKVRESKRLQSPEGYDVGEAVLDTRVRSLPRTYLIQVVKKPGGRRAYVLHGWTQLRGHFSQAEPELRKVMDTLRILE